MRMPNLLLVHNGDPGRFTFLAEALIARGWSGALLNQANGRAIPGLETVIMDPLPEA